MSAATPETMTAPAASTDPDGTTRRAHRFNFGLLELMLWVAMVGLVGIMAVATESVLHEDAAIAAAERNATAVINAAENSSDGALLAAVVTVRASGITAEVQFASDGTMMAAVTGEAGWRAYRVACVRAVAGELTLVSPTECS